MKTINEQLDDGKMEEMLAIQRGRTADRHLGLDAVRG